MRRRVFQLISCIFVLGCLILAGCSEQDKAISESGEKTVEIEKSLEPTADKNLSEKSDYEVTDSEIADVISYSYQHRSMYIAGLKVFEEFGTSNEGSISIRTDENVLTFGMTKATGSVTGALDGPLVYFEMDLETNDVMNKKFKPAPNYAELGKTEFIEHSEEVINLTDERMAEIGEYFRDLILEIEAN